MHKCGTQIHTQGGDTNGREAKKLKQKDCIRKGAPKTNRETCTDKCGTQIHTVRRVGLSESYCVREQAVHAAHNLLTNAW